MTPGRQNALLCVDEADALAKCALCPPGSTYLRWEKTAVNSLPGSAAARLASRGSWTEVPVAPIRTIDGWFCPTACVVTVGVANGVSWRRCDQPAPAIGGVNVDPWAVEGALVADDGKAIVDDSGQAIVERVSE